MENSDKHYTGLEVNFVELIFKRLNLTAQYNLSTESIISYYRIFTQTVGQLEPGSSDLAIGLLPLNSDTIHAVEATIPYLYVKLSWYVPCPNLVSRWKSIYKIFGSRVWACFGAVAILAVIIMWLLAKYETQIHVRESANYKTLMYCIYNVWAVITAVSVPQKPISLSLRIFFITWVWYAVAMTTVYQAYFIGLLVNPGFEKSITTVNDLIQSGIEYGYPVEMDSLPFSDPPYNIIKTNRKTCKTIYKCLQRVIERKDFATIFDKFHAEYFRTRLLFRNIHVHLCTLQEDITTISVSMYTAKGNPLLGRFNDIITHMFESGFFSKWWNDFMSSSRLDDHPFDDDDTNFSDFATNALNTDYTTFSLIQLQVVFLILLIGLIFSTFVFLIEVLYYKVCSSAATSTTQYSPQSDQYIRTKFI
jgi:hypothetical protein